MSKILLSKFCPGVTNKLTYLPICRHKERLQRLDLSFDLLNQQKEGQQQREILTYEKSK